MVYALVTSARKMHPYFQVHLVVVLIDQLMKMVLYRPDNMSQLAKWALELEEFDVKY